MPANQAQGFVINAAYWRDNLKAFAAALGGLEAVLTASRVSIDRRVWLLLPAVLLLLLAFILPVGWLLSRSFTQPRLGWAGILPCCRNQPVYLRVVWNTVLISAMATPLCVLLGFPVAHAMAHGSARAAALAGGSWC